MYTDRERQAKKLWGCGHILHFKLELFSFTLAQGTACKLERRAWLAADLAASEALSEVWKLV